MQEITFINTFGSRCHAIIITDEMLEDASVREMVAQITENEKRYEGFLDGYNIYSRSCLSTPYNYIAIKASI